jgi:hypothetical protein
MPILGTRRRLLLYTQTQGVVGVSYYVRLSTCSIQAGDTVWVPAKVVQTDGQKVIIGEVYNLHRLDQIHTVPPSAPSPDVENARQAEVRWIVDDLQCRLTRLGSVIDSVGDDHVESWTSDRGGKKEDH